MWVRGRPGGHLFCQCCSACGGSDCSLSTLTPGAPPPGPPSTPPYPYTATALADASFLSRPEAHAATRYAPPPLPGADASPTPPPSTGEGDYVVVSPEDIAAAAGRVGGKEGEAGEGAA